MALRKAGRTKRVRLVVDDLLREQLDQEERRCGFVHMYGVAQVCPLLAIRRRLDAELAAVAGMLHDIWTYQASDLSDHEQHEPRSARLARQILSELGCFTLSEMATVCEAIAHHGMKDETHDAYDELLKDADVLQHHLYNTLLRPNRRERVRLAALFRELGLAEQGGQAREPQ